VKQTAWQLTLSVTIAPDPGAAKLDDAAPASPPRALPAWVYNHPALTRRMQAYLRWRNTHARHPDVLAAQRRERARIRSERQQRWGHPKPKAA